MLMTIINPKWNLSNYTPRGIAHSGSIHHIWSFISVYCVLIRQHLISIWCWVVSSVLERLVGHLDNNANMSEPNMLACSFVRVSPSSTCPRSGTGLSVFPWPCRRREEGCVMDVAPLPWCGPNSIVVRSVAVTQVGPISPPGESQWRPFRWSGAVHLATSQSTTFLQFIIVLWELYLS